MKKKVILPIIMLITIVMLTACGGKTAEENEREKNMVDYGIEQEEKAKDAVDAYNKDVQNIQNAGDEVDE